MAFSVSASAESAPESAASTAASAAAESAAFYDSLFDEAGTATEAEAGISVAATPAGSSRYTIETLQRYAHDLIAWNTNPPESRTNTTTTRKRNKSRPLHPPQPHKVCLYLAGGGTTAVAVLAGTSGASSLLLESRTLYDRYALLQACAVPDADTVGPHKVAFASRAAAILASQAALQQALTVTALSTTNFLQLPGTIGIGCTSALVTTPPTNTSSSDSSSTGSGGRGNIVATRSDGLRLLVTLQMTAGRTRFEEELVLSHYVYRTLERMMRRRHHTHTFDENANTNNTYVTHAGDTISQCWEYAEDRRPPATRRRRQTESTADTEAETEAKTDTSILNDSSKNTTNKTDAMDTVIDTAARRVIEGGEEAVVLVPLYSGTDSTMSLRAVTDTLVLPNQCLIFPGSFNPLHVGHLALATAAIRTLEHRVPYLHRRSSEKPLLFEMSITNVDKPSIDPHIIRERIRTFVTLCEEATTLFPQQWGIVLTRAPLFEEKVTILRSKVVVAAANYQDNDNATDTDTSVSVSVRTKPTTETQQLNFVIGTDTLVRIINPKYYHHDRAQMYTSLVELQSKGVRFIVGGRVEQQQQQQQQQSLPAASSSSSSVVTPPSKQFVTGREELNGLPDTIRSMFTIMEESEFRVDLSSSEIRSQQQQQQQQQPNTSVSD